LQLAKYFCRILVVSPQFPEVKVSSSQLLPNQRRERHRVGFRWRDYAHGSKQRIMTLDAIEFLRRFFLHVPPKGFVRIRRYGLLANRFRNRLLPLAHTLLAAQGREQLAPPPAQDCDLWHCPRCGKAMRVVERFTAAQLHLAAFDSS
jgi:hypothetical protein